jgi:general secretion pathway protein G
MRKGVTKLEVSIILVIALILASLIIPRVARSTDGHGSPRTSRDIAEIRNAFRRFHLACDRYPTTTESLEVLTDGKNIKGWRGPYLEKDLLTDPWGNAYQYETVGANAFRVWSYGADGRADGTGEGEDIDPFGTGDQDAN